jgi:deoxyribonuclease V
MGVLIEAAILAVASADARPRRHTPSTRPCQRTPATCSPGVASTFARHGFHVVAQRKPAAWWHTTADTTAPGARSRSLPPDATVRRALAATSHGSSGGARAAAVVAADAPLPVCWPNAPRPCPRWRPAGPVSSAGGNCRRCAVVGCIAGLGLLVAGGYAGPGPDGRPGLGAHAHAEFGIAVIGVVKTGVRHRHSRRTGAAGDLRAPSFCPRRRGGAGAAHGGPVPATRRAAPRRSARPHRAAASSPAEPPPGPIDAERGRSTLGVAQS